MTCEPRALPFAACGIERRSSTPQQCTLAAPGLFPPHTPTHSPPGSRAYHQPQAVTPWRCDPYPVRSYGWTWVSTATRICEWENFAHFLVMFGTEECTSIGSSLEHFVHPLCSNDSIRGSTVVIYCTIHFTSASLEDASISCPCRVCRSGRPGPKSDVAYVPAFITAVINGYTITMMIHG